MLSVLQGWCKNVSGKKMAKKAHEGNCLIIQSCCVGVNSDAGSESAFTNTHDSHNSTQLSEVLRQLEHVQPATWQAAITAVLRLGLSLDRNSGYLPSPLRQQPAGKLAPVHIIRDSFTLKLLLLFNRPNYFDANTNPIYTDHTRSSDCVATLRNTFYRQSIFYDPFSPLRIHSSLQPDGHGLSKESKQSAHYSL